MLSPTIKLFDDDTSLYVYKLFADDTSLYVNEDAVTATNQLNNYSSQISKWDDIWLVKFNAGKSKALTVTLNRNQANI